jgi:hypothetical protein
MDERPRCLACGTLIDGPPEAETYRIRGAFAIVMQWRTCSCGAFALTQRVRPRLAVEAREAPAGSRRSAS